jgi:hypothetical protein
LYADSLIPPSYTLDQIVTATEEAVSTLASSLASRIICSFDKVEAGKLFFQCVYIKLQEVESEGLLELHRALRKAFKEHKDPMGETYFPHMSLVYGDLEMQAKEAIISDMREKAEIKNVDASQGEEQQTRESVLGETQFETNEILIVKTAGRSDQWEIAARVPLGKRGLKHEDL